MNQSKVQLVNSPTIAVAEDRPGNARVVDNAAANIGSWAKGALHCNGPDAVAGHHWQTGNRHGRESPG